MSNDLGMQESDPSLTGREGSVESTTNSGITGASNTGEREAKNANLPQQTNAPGASTGAERSERQLNSEGQPSD